jgi:hypothetical protein
MVSSHCIACKCWSLYGVQIIINVGICLAEHDEFLRLTLRLWENSYVTYIKKTYLS